MARLLSRQDRNHRHALLGLFSLLHFLFRLTSAIWSGNAFLPAEPVALTLLGLAPHALIHLTSLTLPLPRKRNLSAPMIWPEFRLHSAVFAGRTLVATCAGFWLWPLHFSGSQHPVAYALVLGTCALADLVTARVGDKEQRTTNAMPYAAHVTAVDVAHAKAVWRVQEAAAWLGTSHALAALWWG